MAIGDISATIAPSITLSWQHREFPSPNEQWTAVYRDCQQNRMGVMRWQLSLQRPAGEEYRVPPELLRTNQREGWMCPSDLRPWRYDSGMLVALSWDRTPSLFNTETGTVTACAVTGAPLTAQWGNAQPYLIAVYFGQIDLLDGSGRQISRIMWESAEDEIPYTGWTEDDAYFFMVTHRSRSAQTQITFFVPEDSLCQAQTILLAPNDLVPYDSARYSGMERNEASLELCSGHRVTGLFLDTWNQIWFDPTQHRLLLSVFRPIDDVPQSEYTGSQNGRRICQVEEKWISVCLRP